MSVEGTAEPALPPAAVHAAPLPAGSAGIAAAAAIASAESAEGGQPRQDEKAAERPVGNEDAAPAAKADDAEEEMCRYCFEGREAGELISPCSCAGGQKWVHLSCLRRWQRGVLVSQPTHPDFYDDDLRHKVCNVCKAPYRCKPPTRMELMESFTGEELAALIEERCVIASHRAFSADLRRQMEGITGNSAALREHMVDRHWIDGIFLITQVVEDAAASKELRIRTQEDVTMFAESVSADWSMQVRGRSFRLVFDGALEPFRDADVPTCRAAIKALHAPCTLRLVSAEDEDCGEDGIVAVNLTQPVDISPWFHRRLTWQNYLHRAFRGSESLLCPVRHYVGGPCHEETPQVALLVTGVGEYKIFSSVVEAIRRSQDAAKKQQSGQAQGSGDAANAGAPAADTPLATPPAKKRRRDAATDLGEAPEGEPGAAGPSQEAAHSQAPSAPAGPSAAVAVATAAPDATGAAVALGAGATAGEGRPPAEGSGGGSQSADARPGGREAADADAEPAQAPAAKPADAAKHAAADGAGAVDYEPRLLIFWGTAGWSRCQLMSEIARGSWGLCKADDTEVTEVVPEELYEKMHPRLVFAPKTEMSDTYGSAPDDDENRLRLMQIHRRLRRRQLQVQRQLQAQQQVQRQLQLGRQAIAEFTGDASWSEGADTGLDFLAAAAARSLDTELASVPSSESVSSSDDCEEVESLSGEEEGEEEHDGDEDAEEGAGDAEEDAAGPVAPEPAAIPGTEEVLSEQRQAQPQPQGESGNAAAE